eukprot:SAG31_NODE_487_length_14980_cov_9.526376_5_plen_146_part_00
MIPGKRSKPVYGNGSGFAIGRGSGAGTLGRVREVVSPVLAVVSSVFSCSGKLVRTSTTTSWLPTIADKLGPVEVPLSVCQIASRTLSRVPDANPSISHSAVIVLAFGLAFDRTTAVRLPESGPAHTCIGSPGFAAGGGTGGCGGL